MRILLLADEEDQGLWDFYRPGKLDGIDLIISCGDLKSSYLQFLVTMARCPVLYVHGNHDVHYSQDPPEGCDCIDGALIEYNGYRIVGLGGCRRYHPGDHQYSEREMRHRIGRLKYLLWIKKGPDILVTHCPAEGLGDAEDPAHRGFAALRDFLDKYRPGYMFHGHVHMCYDHSQKQERTYGDTKIINVGKRYVIDLPDREVPVKRLNQVVWLIKSPFERSDLEIIRRNSQY